MIYILYSNDYEVCLGGNYYPESEVLIETTERVLSVCEDIGIRMTLFCDLPCLWRYRELGYGQFPDSVDDQLKNTIGRGHDVQAHIHPHWLETEIVCNEEGISQYNFDLSKFLLGSWFPEGGTALQSFCADVFKRAKSYLENLLHPVNPSYRCIAFRAGGYGIQPNTKEVIEALIDTGYLIDSSIVPGMVLSSNVNRVDFSQVPKKGNYFISPEIGLSKVSEAGIFEIPVMALRQGEAGWLLVKALMLKGLRHFLKRERPKKLGYNIQTTGQTAGSLWSGILHQIGIIRRGWWMLELGPDANLMVNATKRYINRYSHGERDLYFSVSCHSKSTSHVALDALGKFHGNLKNIYGEQLKAITFQEAACNLNLS